MMPSKAVWHAINEIASGLWGADFTMFELHYFPGEEDAFAAPFTYMNLA